ncbi:MAG TPA: DUF72 domain-containing protein [Ktedonobacteraceae bacterium]
MFYIGCPLWGYKAWVGTFFPPRTPANAFLHVYSQRLNTVEGNTIFYALPSAEMVARWRQETPDSFRFCPKIPRAISHESLLSESKEAMYAVLERLRGLGSRLGPLFLQLPPSFAPEQMAQLRAFLAFWPSSLRLAVEVRHPDFFREAQSEELDRLLRDFQVARVIMDTRPIRVGSAKEQREFQARERKPDLPVSLVSTTDFVFLRYIGHPRMEENAPFLDMWAKQLAQWWNEGKTLYVFCHCPFEEHSPAICQEFYKRVSELVPLPPLEEFGQTAKSSIEQQRLF